MTTQEITHRVEYLYRCGVSVSSPHVFKSDDEAIEFALKHKEEDTIAVKVLTYGITYADGHQELLTTYQEGKTKDLERF